ncbi:MAG: RtcB family protein, partial [Phycisphaerae bacterium]
MKKRELINLGYPHGPALDAALHACGTARQAGVPIDDIRTALASLIASPASFADDAIWADTARELSKPCAGPHSYKLNDSLRYRTWGEDIDNEAHKQMQNACRLPVSVAAALMPDAHVGYGLPIGGVLATEDAVIPYAVGVDIACRVRLTVYDMPAK